MLPRSAATLRTERSSPPCAPDDAPCGSHAIARTSSLENSTSLRIRARGNGDAPAPAAAGVATSSAVHSSPLRGSRQLPLRHCVPVQMSRHADLPLNTARAQPQSTLNIAHARAARSRERDAPPTTAPPSATARTPHVACTLVCATRLWRDMATARRRTRPRETADRAARSRERDAPPTTAPPPATARTPHAARTLV